MSEALKHEPGFAAALSRYAAQGGSVRTDKRGKRFMEGPHKGKTVEQVTEEAKDLWETASPAIKAKYTRRATLTPGPMVPEGDNEDGQGKMLKKTEAPKSEPMPGSDEARAAALTETSRNEWANTADAGGGAAMAAAQSMYRKNQARDEAVRRGVATPDEVSTAKKMEADARASDTARRQSEIDAARRSDNQALRGEAGLSPTVNPNATAGAGRGTPIGGRRGGASVSGQQGRISSGGSPNSSAEMITETADVADKNWQNVEKQPVKKSAAPQQSTTSSATNPTRAELEAKPVRINPLTGQPFGLIPQGVHQQMKQEAYDQKSAQDASAMNARRMAASLGRGPLSQPPKPYKSPLAPGGAFSNEAYARTAKAIETGEERLAIREGRASDATKAKHADYVKKMADDTKAWSGVTPYDGKAPVVGGVGSRPGSKVLSIRPGTGRPMQPMAQSKPRFALARR